MSAPLPRSWMRSIASPRRLPTPSASKTPRRTKYRGIGHAAAGTESVARSIAGTATATENTNRSADLVLSTARDLSDQAADLRASVDRFLSNVAA